jgi:ubiquitin-protein ligase
MVDSLRNRINKEYQDLLKSEVENNIKVVMVENDIRHWKGKIKGPVNYIKSR